MPYPESPFEESLDTKLLSTLKNSSNINCNNCELQETLKWLCTTPKLTSFRVNILKNNKKTINNLIQNHLDKVLGSNNSIKTEYSNFSEDLIVFKHLNNNNRCKDEESMIKYPKEIIIDTECASAVLRGAHIYAPGVLGMLSHTQLMDNVSIYADLSKKCRKGFMKLYDDEENEMKLFIGNGIVRKTREELFRGGNLLNNKAQGVAIEMLEVISGCPSIGNEFLPAGSALLQNIPSVLCVRALNPGKNDKILDMCAAPGHKTTHIAALMQQHHHHQSVGNNDGYLIAIDKTPNKIALLKKNCNLYGATNNVQIFQADSTKLLQNNNNINDTFRFTAESFDKILLDAPCSALGKRPQLKNSINEKSLISYIPLQRKLFTSAVELLKPQGRLVYSTCTITLAENEGIVAWALKTFNCLNLIKSDKESHFGGPGWHGTDLSEEERKKVQRFGPNQIVDSIGFFIAIFIKK